MPVQVAVDVGGTFTDICVVDDESGKVRVAKAPSTKDPIDGVLEAIRLAAVELPDVALIRHGTTVATNALITRNLPRVIMVTTAGFRDVLEMGRGAKEALWDHYDDSAPPYIPRRDRLEINERVDYLGNVVRSVDPEDARTLAEVLRARNAAAVAVCLMNSYANPANEIQLRDLLKEELPDIPIYASSEVLPQIFEHDRFATAVANAALAPLVSGYVDRLEKQLESGGYSADLLVLHSGGGMMTSAAVSQFPVRLAGSGIAAGAIAARHIASLCGISNAIGLDMGGTSSDVSLVSDGKLLTTNEWHVEFGLPIAFPSIEVLTVGAGGGSLAWVDPAGALHSGPQSAGSTPGPVSYRRGGTVPTTTDANAVLGRLGAGLAGGSLSLDVEAAQTALESVVGRPLELETVAAARAVIQVANANMADAVRLISVRRGLDPRDFSLVVFGGGGPLHAVAVARELSIPHVVIPPHPGITSAMGCLLVDVRHDLTKMFLLPVEDLDVERAKLEAATAELEALGRERLSAEGVAPTEMTFTHALDMRYQGQWRSLTVTLPPDGVWSAEKLTEMFHQAHAREHNYRRDGVPIEIFKISVEATGATPRPQLASAAREPYAPTPSETQSVYFDEDGAARETAVYDRAELLPGAAIPGPAIIYQLDSTTLVPPDVTAEVDEYFNLRMDV